eukprot:3170384-Pyramimonas_sp.AAC.1
MAWSLRPQSASVAASCQISNEIAAFRIECDFKETKARSMKEQVWYCLGKYAGSSHVTSAS